MRQVDWYFDFISPFAYLQHECFHRLPSDIRVNYKPVLFAAMLNHWQNIGPAEIPPKRVFTYRHVTWQGRKLGVPFKFPESHPFNPIKVLRLALAKNCTGEAVTTIFRHIWAEGRNPEQPENFRSLVEKLGIEDVDSAISTPQVKQTLRANGEEAIARGVFGVPTFHHEGELFWGKDAGDMFLDYLEDPDFFKSEEMKRVVNLPIGTARR